MTDELAIILVLVPVVLMVYAYLIYPLLLQVLGWFRPLPVDPVDPVEWPPITIAVPAYNEARSIENTINSLLSLDYPPDRRQIVIMSDASTDGTDAVVERYCGSGVELIRMPHRMGKGQMENLAARQFRGEIVVNTDATIRITPGSLKPLIRVFQDPSLGCASGRDVSVGRLDSESNRGESGYVGFEMWLRDLETRAGGIIGASGCFYAIRRHLVDEAFPPVLSRDFAAPLQTRLSGLRTVSVRDAVCLVPRATSLRAEYRRKIRTMARGLRTLFAYRRLLNPFRYGLFAWMLWSHKLARWLVFLLLPLLVPGLWLLSPTRTMSLLLVAGVVGGVGAASVALKWPEGRPMPRLLALPGFAVLTCAAGFQSWLRALSGRNDAIWEPTRR
jgi:cellulose synthase/poly-beta-1,6-N-acetylglucosamine synthase-like glycosyltransferase